MSGGRGSCLPAYGLSRFCWLMSQKILVVEDQPPVLKMITSRLKSEGYTVVTAKDGQEGIEKVKSENPDLVITDLAMPRMTGNVLVRIMKLSEQHKRIPIIMLSAFVHEKMGEGVEVPADAYIPKPFDGARLVAKVKELLGT